MKKLAVMCLAAAGCSFGVGGEGAIEESQRVDDGAIAVTLRSLTIVDRGEVTTIASPRAIVDRSNPFRPRAHLPFSHDGHAIEVEMTKITNLVANGGAIGAYVDEAYQVVEADGLRTDTRRTGAYPLGFDLSVDGRLVRVELDIDASFHCPPFPSSPARPEEGGAPPSQTIGFD